MYGEMNCISLGVSMEWLVYELPHPDSIKTYGNYQTVWRYGDLQLVFLGSTLMHIVVSCKEVPTFGESIDVDNWFLEKDLTLKSVMSFLKEQQISFFMRRSKQGMLREIVIEQSGTVLGFDHNHALLVMYIKNDNE